MTELSCPMCAARTPAPRGSDHWTRCGMCDAMLFAKTAGPLVLVGHGSDEMSQQIGAVLVTEGFSPMRAADGIECIHVLRTVRPAAAVLDVAMDKLNSFEIIEELRADEAIVDTKVVLIASVFSKTAYKRQPKSLYGADDYVEQHHIPDLLPVKLAALLGVEAKGISDDHRSRVEGIRDAEMRNDLKGHRRVRALAQAIVADIALYHEAEVESLVADPQSDGLLGPLAEGRRMLAEVAREIDYPSADPLGDAWELFIAGRTKAP